MGSEIGGILDKAALWSRLPVCGTRISGLTDLWFVLVVFVVIVEEIVDEFDCGGLPGTA